MYPIQFANSSQPDPLRPQNYFPKLKWIDALMGGDNLAAHCSTANLKESRTLLEQVKIVWAFTPGGCTDIVAGPDADLVEQEKINLRKFYKKARLDQPNKWRKSKNEGGHTEADRRRLYAQWVSDSRKKFMRKHYDMIWSTVTFFFLSCITYETWHCRDVNLTRSAFPPR